MSLGSPFGHIPTPFADRVVAVTVSMPSIRFRSTPVMRYNAARMSNVGASRLARFHPVT